MVIAMCEAMFGVGGVCRAWRATCHVPGCGGLDVPERGDLYALVSAGVRHLGEHEVPPRPVVGGEG
jgi:hypothetical protein